MLHPSTSLRDRANPFPMRLHASAFGFVVEQALHFVDPITALTPLCPPHSVYQAPRQPEPVVMSLDAPLRRSPLRCGERQQGVFFRAYFRFPFVSPLLVRVKGARTQGKRK